MKKASFDAKSGKFIGFVTGFDANGFPVPIEISNVTAQTVNDVVKKYPQATTLYVYVVRSVTPGAAPFVIAIFGTDNKFTCQDAYLHPETT